jgi:hypothetical protein
MNLCKKLAQHIKREYIISLDTYLDLCTQFYELRKQTAPEDALAFIKVMQTKLIVLS